MSKKTNKNFIARARLLQQEERLLLPSEEARELEALFDEVGKNNTHLDMTLVQTREKLKPFVDEGVVHKDRKREVKMADESSKPKDHSKLEEIICDYRVKIFEYITNKKIVPELEKLITELTNLPEDSESNYILGELRMHIIQGQICLSKFHEWREQQRER